MHPLGLEIEIHFSRYAAHIQDYEHALSLVTPRIREHAGIVFIQRNVLALQQRLVGVPHREQLPVVVQNRIRIALFSFHVVIFVTVVHRQPRSGGAESGVGLGVPLHRGALAIAAFFFGPAQLSHRILYVFRTFGIVVFHSNLFAVVHDGGAAQGQVERCHQFRDLVVVLAVAVAVVHATNIMVADDVHRPTAGVVDPLDLLAEIGGRQFVDGGEHEVHGHVHFIVVLSVIFLELLDVAGPSFANQHRVVLVGNFAEALQYAVEFGLVFVVDFALDRISKGVPFGSHDRIVAELGIDKHDIHCIQTKTGDAALVPPAGHVEHVFFNFGIAPIQVGLRWIKIMVEPLAGRGVVFPCGTSKQRSPIIRRLLRIPCVAPDVPVPLGIRARRLRLLKPLVLIGGIGHDKIEQHTDIARLALGQQFVHVAQRAVVGIDAVVVGYVVTPIHVWRWKHRRDPNRIYSQPTQIVELRSNSGKITIPSWLLSAKLRG